MAHRSLDQLLPLAAAIDGVIAAAEALRARRPAGSRSCELWEARGRVLAQDVRADRDDPPFDRAAMDGYALRSEDTGPQGARLRVVGEITAGDLPDRTVGAGEAMAIMTGAPVPEGADAVQMVERVRVEGDHVVVDGPVPAGQNVAPRGELARAGDVVASKGEVIRGLTMGVLASVGAAKVDVFVRPRVTVVTTGSELVGVADAPGPSEIRDSNRHMVLGLVGGWHGRAVDGGTVVDDEAPLKRAIRAGLESDVLVLTGGVSAGVRDLVAACLAEEGVTTRIHGVRVKPGKPVLVGEHPGGLVFGLPGNPVSAFVTAELLLAPALAVLGMRAEVRGRRQTLPLVGEVTLPATKGRASFYGGRLVPCADGGLGVEGLTWRGSADQVGFARAEVLIHREARSAAAAPGERVEVWTRP